MQINQAILSARVIDGVLSSESFSKEQLVGIIDKMGAQGVEEYQKAIPIFTLDLALNFSSLVDSIDSDSSDVWNVSHPEIVDEIAKSYIDAKNGFYNA